MIFQKAGFFLILLIKQGLPIILQIAINIVVRNFQKFFKKSLQIKRLLGQAS